MILLVHIVKQEADTEKRESGGHLPPGDAPISNSAA